MHSNGSIPLPTTNVLQIGGRFNAANVLLADGGGLINNSIEKWDKN
jgi:hypothetical protein